MLRKWMHQHHQIVEVRLPVIGPTINEWRAAQAKQRMDMLSIYPWEPGAPFPTGGRINVEQTWKDRG
jgi:hypothetical protein